MSAVNFSISQPHLRISSHCLRQQLCAFVCVRFHGDGCVIKHADAWAAASDADAMPCADQLTGIHTSKNFSSDGRNKAGRACSTRERTFVDAAHSWNPSAAAVACDGFRIEGFGCTRQASTLPGPLLGRLMPCPVLLPIGGSVPWTDRPAAGLL